MPLLQVKNVSINKPGSRKKIGSFDTQTRLVDNVSCELDAGDVLAIIGPNGAGKSTLLKAIAGDLPCSGDIEIQGLQPMQKKRARQVAVLPQLSLLNFPFRVSEVVALSRIPHNSGQQRDKQIVTAALELMDIGFLSHRLYTELSGGEKQRVQLARVLAQIWDVEDAPCGTRLLLLDEPTTALDVGHQQQLMKAIREFAQKGVAVLMVLHGINLAAHYADSILALLCSQPVAYGPVEEVVTAENMRTLFGIQAQVISHPEHNTPIVIGL